MMAMSSCSSTRSPHDTLLPVLETSANHKKSSSMLSPNATKRHLRQSVDTTAQLLNDLLVTQENESVVSTVVHSAERLERSLQLLEAVVVETQSNSTKRQALLQSNESARIQELDTSMKEQLARMEELYATIQLLQRELEVLRNPNEYETLAVTTAPSTAKTSKRPATKWLKSPYASCSKTTNHDVCRTAEVRLRPKADILPTRQTEVRSASATTPSTPSISFREERLRESLSEKTHWQDEYKCMREQVVEEKLRQVELFRRLEALKRDHRVENERLELALREADMENRLLKTQLAQSKVQVVHQRHEMDALMRQAKEEKEKLVCCIAETRHKFKEWKEGEASTLKAARDQAVHNLRTEYELKIARHQEEKQKLRDKVKDLEVSLRLLQKDRHLSPLELSQRKASILKSRVAGSTTEAELIEATCRIKELEALVDHAREYQKRQEEILKVSEATIARLVHEREVAALENLTMTALPLPRANNPPPSSTSADTMSSMTSLTSSASVSFLNRSFREDTAPPSPRRPPPLGMVRTASNSQNDMTNLVIETTGPADREKELLRCQSIVLTAEVEKYRQIVVHSLDEIRTLKDSRRRSQQGLLATKSPTGQSTTVNEYFFVQELTKLQREMEELKAMEQQHRQRRTHRVNEVDEDEDPSDDSDSDKSSEEPDPTASGALQPPAEAPAAPAAPAAPDSSTKAPVPSIEAPIAEQLIEPPPTEQLIETNPVEPKDSVDSEDQADDRESEAVSVIQRKSKAFLLRKDFIKKRAAIDKIKAQYRGYLVRKNIEILDPFARKAFVISHATQLKLQMTPLHESVERTCHGIVLRVDVRISKDPPVVQLQLFDERSDRREPMSIRYFHLFEMIAMLPRDQEEIVLEHTDEPAIAKLLASMLVITVLNDEYRVLLAPMTKAKDGAVDDEYEGPGTLLADLPVQITPNDRDDEVEETPKLPQDDNILVPQ